MFLSRIELDITKRETQKALITLSHLHGAVESAFPGEKKRRLWRLDDLYGKKYLLILSENKPDFSGIQRQFGYPDRDGETLSYDKLLNRISDGTMWRFKLTANPTYSKGSEGERGKIYCEVSAHYMIEWLQKKAVSHGFLLMNAEDISAAEGEKVDVGTLTGIKEIKWCSFMKNDKNKVRFKSVTYEGILKVTDAELFKATLLNGIGREKAYGMGLMTLIRV